MVKKWGAKISKPSIEVCHWADLQDDITPSHGCLMGCLLRWTSPWFTTLIKGANNHQKWQIAVGNGVVTVVAQNEELPITPNPPKIETFKNQLVIGSLGLSN